MTCKLSISVIICTFNGAIRLPVALQAIAHQQIDPAISWEIIVVDNASTDETIDVANAWISRFGDKLRVVSEPRPGKAYALHKAVNEASGEFYCIVDDDNLLDSNYLAAGLAFLRSHPECAVIGGRTFPSFPHGVTPPADFEQRFANLLACRDRGTDIVWDVVPPGAGQMGRISLLRRVYEQIGTRLEDRVGEGVGCCEDLEKGHVLQRLGWRTAHVPELRLYHVMSDRRLTGEYIDALTCAAISNGPWLRLVAGKDPNSTCWQMFRASRDHLRVVRYALLSLLPNRLHRKLKRADFWKRFYSARARGYRELVRDRDRIRQILKAINDAPDDMRPPASARYTGSESIESFTPETCSRSTS